MLHASGIHLSGHNTDTADLKAIHHFPLWVASAVLCLQNPLIMRRVFVLCCVCAAQVARVLADFQFFDTAADYPKDDLRQKLSIPSCGGQKLPLTLQPGGTLVWCVGWGRFGRAVGSSSSGM